MAQLHRRILRLPHPRRLAAAGIAAAVLVACPVVGHAQAGEQASATSIASDARALRSADARDAAIQRLCNLPVESLGAVKTRITELRGTRATGDAGYAALGEFGAAAGAASPSDPRDLLPGLIAFPDDRFSQTHATVAERYCLLRSLDRMGTAEALVVALPLVTFEIRAFRWQARHVVRRAGKRSTAMVIRAASLPNAEVDLWAGWALQTLGIRDSGDSVQGQSEESLVEVLRAYASVRHIGGMPVVASFVDDPRSTVRAAARDSLALYGENSIWELRRLYQTRTGKDPGNRSWQLLLRDLSQELDERREAPLRERAARAVAAANEGKLDEAGRIADELLITAPVSPATRALAPVFFARARAAAAAGRIDDARAQVDRALRLGPSTPDADVLALRDQIRDAELVRHGIVEDHEERPVLAANAAQARITERRSLARYGFFAAFVLLSIQTLLAVGRRLASEAAIAARGVGSEARRRYENGGREKLQASLSQLRSESSQLARAGFEIARDALERLRDARSAVPRARSMPRSVADEAPAQTHAAVVDAPAQNQAAVVEAPTQTHVAIVEAPLPTGAAVEAHGPNGGAFEAPVPAAQPMVRRTRERTLVPKAAQPATTMTTMPKRPIPAPNEAEAARLRKERPTRRAVANADLFTSAGETTLRRRAR